MLLLRMNGLPAFRSTVTPTYFVGQAVPEEEYWRKGKKITGKQNHSKSVIPNSNTALAQDLGLSTFS